MLDPGDEVEVKTVHGTELLEVRVHNRIPKSRLSWIGERTNDGTVRPG